MPIPKIIRKAGPNRRKYGILLDGLDPWYQRVLFDNPLIKEELKVDDQFVQVLFKIADMERSHKRKHKMYYNPYTEEITDYSEVLEQSLLIDWNCAICRTSIQSEVANFKIANFICNKCKKSHNKTNKRIDPRIVDSSSEFHKFCRDQLIREQKRFLKYVKHFETGYQKGKK